MEAKTSFKTKLRRVLLAGFVNFFRSGYVSLASVLVMIITLSTISGVIFMNAIFTTTLNELRNKVDINVYFVTTAPEQDILDLQSRLEALPEVATIEYISREQALENFKLRHENDQVTLQALEELGENPLGAALNIKAREPSQYQGIADFLGEGNILSRDGAAIIDKVNYLDNKVAIDRLTKIIDSSQRLSFIATILLILISIVITFNTVRLVIYVSREEIGVMQLVGASRNYIRGPFVVTGIMYGIVAAIVTLVVFLPITYWLGEVTQNFFIGLNIFDYYISNMFEMLILIIGSGVAIGAASSLLAVRRYLKL